MSKTQATNELWRRGILRFKLHPLQKKIYDEFYQNTEDYFTTMLISRQTGKCAAGGTLVATPSGSVPIENISVGDIVYGYNIEGKIEKTEVKQVHKQGVKKVIDLLHRGRVVASVTKDHKWLVYNTVTKKDEIITTEELLKSKHKKIKRKFFNPPGGDVHEPHAYSLGVLLGDGCCLGKANSLLISSESEHIPKVVATELGCYFWKLPGHSFFWILSNSYRPGKGNTGEPVQVNYYDLWCKNKKAHQKICSYEEIKRWTRESQLRFLAGLIDTDGSICVVGRKKNELKFAISMQSKTIIDTVKKLFLDLWQINLCEQVDNRTKYKNGPCYTLYLNNNLYVKRFLKELTQYLVLETKKYKKEYDQFNDRNTNAEYVGVVAGNEYEIETYDIGLNNGTHLYALANGLITHNSYMLAVLAIETCLRKPDAVVKFVTPKLRMIKNILNKNMKSILKDCPADVMPEWKENEKIWKFPNGSEIQAAGTDNKHYDSIRGGTTDLWIVDEAGFCNDLEDVVYSVLTPTTTMTKGKGLLSSTPDPNEPEHPFVKIFVEKAKKEDKLYKYTIYDNPMLSAEEIEQIVSRYPDREKNVRFRAEYMCELVKDSTKSVIPEFDETAEQEIVTDQIMYPPYFDYYLSMDIGGKDFTSILIAYYDFINDSVVVIDEIIHRDRQATRKIAESIYEKISEHFNEKPPYLMFADNNNIILLNDLRTDHRLNFIPTQKDNKQAAINKVKLLINNRQLTIHPRCKNLISHLRSAKWAENTKSGYKEFARDSEGGHFDSLDALIYLVRNIIYGKNPYPKNYNALGTADYYQRPREVSENKDVFNRMFKSRSSIKINK